MQGNPCIQGVREGEGKPKKPKQTYLSNPLYRNFHDGQI